MKRQVTFKGEKVQATEVSFDISKEDWNVYNLMDGTTLKVKTTVMSIVRLDEYYNEVGDPIYMVNSQNAITCIEVPDHLRKGEQVSP